MLAFLALALPVRGDRRRRRRTPSAARLPAALAAGRGMGVEPLAALRRARLYRLLQHQAQRRLAAAARRPPQPRPARAPPRLGAERLAAALVAPWRGKVSAAPPAAAAQRALRTLTQGHMAQHMFFHSLHQFAVPARARRIFGVSRERYLALRRAELSPIQIGMLYGRSPAQVQAAVIATLRERARAGVRTRSTPAAQARPAAHPPGQPGPALAAAVALQRPAADPPPRLPPRDAARDAAQLRVQPGDLRRRQPASPTRPTSSGCRWPSAPARSACSRRPSRAAPARWSPQPRRATRARPTTPPSPATGASSRSRSRPGNLNFAKRYGQIHVNVHDASTGETSRGQRARSRSRAFALGVQPVAVGRRPAARVLGRRRRRQHGDLGARHAGTGPPTLATPRPPGAPAGDAYGGRLSGDGRWLVFTWVPRDGSGLARLPARPRDRRDHAGRPRRGSDRRRRERLLLASGGVERRAVRGVQLGCAQPRRGRARGARVRARPADRHHRRWSAAARTESGFEPAISADGARVAYTSARGGRSRVLVYDRATGKTTAVSGGKGISFDPSLSGDGTRVAFASNRRDLAPTRSTGARSVYVRDLATGPHCAGQRRARGQARRNRKPPACAASDGHVAVAIGAVDRHAGGAQRRERGRVRDGRSGCARPPRSRPPRAAGARAAPGRPWSALPWWATFSTSTSGSASAAGHLALRVGREEHVRPRYEAVITVARRFGSEPGSESRSAAASTRSRRSAADPEQLARARGPHLRSAGRGERHDAAVVGAVLRQAAVEQQPHGERLAAPRRARPGGPPARASAPPRRARARRGRAAWPRGPRPAGRRRPAPSRRRAPGAASRRPARRPGT